METNERVATIQARFGEAMDLLKADHKIQTPDGTFSIDTEAGLILFERPAHPESKGTFKYIVNYPKEWTIEELFKNLAFIIYPYTAKGEKQE